MNTREQCTITINIGENYDREWGFELEDVVKNAWGCMVPFFTRRHHVRNGAINLEDGAVRIEWRYELVDADAQGIEAGTATTEGRGPKGESPVTK